MSDEQKFLPNPNIVDAGKSTRFGAEGGPDPSASGYKTMTTKNPSRVRAALQRIAAADFDISKPMNEKTIASVFGREGTLTGAQIFAVQKAKQAMGNWKAMDSLIDAIDGKQVQKVIETKVTLEQILSRSEEIEEQDEQGTGSSSGEDSPVS